MPLPDYESRQLPEDHYIFIITKEPELRKKTNDITGKETKWIVFSFETEEGRFHTQNLFPWDDEYRDLAIAFNAPKDEKGNPRMSQIKRFVGKQFEADIIHEVDDKKNTWARIRNVTPLQQGEGEVLTQEKEDEDDIPF